MQKNSKKFKKLDSNTMQIMLIDAASDAKSKRIKVYH
jgi:hypothetical protein